MERVLSYHPWCPPFAMTQQMFNSTHQRSDFSQTLNEFLQDPKSIQMHRVLWYVDDCISCVWRKKKGFATECCTLLQNKPKESYESRRGRSFIFPSCKYNLLFGTIICKFEQTSIPTAHSHPNKNYSILNL